MMKLMLPNPKVCAFGGWRQAAKLGSLPPSGLLQGSVPTTIYCFNPTRPLVELVAAQ